jgi:hypothetical protein
VKPSKGIHGYTTLLRMLCEGILPTGPQLEEGPEHEDFEEFGCLICMGYLTAHGITADIVKAWVAEATTAWETNFGEASEGLRPYKAL